MNSTLNFGILTVLVFQLKVYYKVDRLPTGLTAQQKGTTAQWYSNKTTLLQYEAKVLRKFALKIPFLGWKFKIVELF